MSTLAEIDKIISERRKNILTYAEMALPESQFRAFRKQVLDELGNKGLLSDLEAVLFTHSKSTRQR